MHVESITPNLLVEDVAASVRFYGDVLDLPLMMAVTSHRKETVSELIDGVDLQFAMLGVDAPILMLQSRQTLVEELPMIGEYPKSGGTFTLYLKTTRLDLAYSNAQKHAAIVKPLAKTWYGADEFYFMDLDGYCIGVSGQGVE